MSLQHLKLRDGAPPDRLVYTILQRPDRGFDAAFQYSLQQRPALKELRPEIRRSILEIDRRENHDAIAQQFDALVGHAITLANHERELAAQQRQLEESQRLDRVHKFKNTTDA